jgi:spermidine/putrescine transport system permease protein
MNDKLYKYGSISLVSGWLFCFAGIPLLLMLVISILTPSYKHLIHCQLSLASYHTLLDPVYIKLFLRSLYLGGITTLACLIIAYPFAYILSQVKASYKPLLLALMIIPFWTSSLIRTYAIMSLIKTKGILNSVLLSLGIIHAPLHLLYTQTAVFIGLVYSLLPYMILPLYANMEKIDSRLIDAARDLGANRLTIFRRIMIPLTLSGISAGCILVFLPAMTLFYIPDILGGAKSLMLGELISNQFLTEHNWPLGAALSLALTILLGLMIFTYRMTYKTKDAEVLA